MYLKHLSGLGIDLMSLGFIFVNRVVAVKLTSSEIQYNNSDKTVFIYYQFLLLMCFSPDLVFMFPEIV